MRHRMGGASETHLGGNNNEVLLDNRGKLSKVQKTMIKEAMKLWKPIQYGVDFTLCSDGFRFGYEPAYQYEDLFIIGINKQKELSYLITGMATEAWASRVIQHRRYYKDYKNKSKFIKFIDKWHTVLF